MAYNRRKAEGKPFDGVWKNLNCIALHRQRKVEP
jgi:hypothetical protein